MIVVFLWKPQLKFEDPIGVGASSYKDDTVKVSQIVHTWNDIHSARSMGL